MAKIIIKKLLSNLDPAWLAPAGKVIKYFIKKMILKAYPLEQEKILDNVENRS